MPQYLYQYRKFNENTLSALINDKMWLAHPSTFNDPFDSTYYYEEVTVEDCKRHFPNKTKTEQEVQDFNKRVKDRLSKIFAKFFVTCFSATSNPDNVLMWSHYTDSHKGFCIKYKVLDNKITHLEVEVPIFSVPDFALKEVVDLELKHIDYKDNMNNKYSPVECLGPTDDKDKETMAKKIKEILHSKFKVWEYEKEYRLVSYPSKEEVEKSTYPQGKLIDLPSDMLEIEEIIFGCRCPDKNIATIKQIFKDKNKDIKFSRCESVDGRFELKIKPMEI